MLFKKQIVTTLFVFTFFQGDPFCNSIPFVYTEDDSNLFLGNPSNADNWTYHTNNFLLQKRQYDLSYNNDKGHANWVSWHIDNSWKGSALRCNCFSIDNQLPDNFFKAPANSYAKSGFDRGHLCPSEDRDLNSEDNAATFLMSNMIPQSPNLNRITWVALEEYCRSLIQKDMELYIIAGGYGEGGEGGEGYSTSIYHDRISVPSHCWKIILILPIGKNDLHRINKQTRIIAVDMPNQQSVKMHPWTFYRTSVNKIEKATSFNFLSNLSVQLQEELEKKIDDSL